MRVKNLTENEQLVLYALVKFPEYNDRKISEILDISDSTVSYCRNQLKKDKLFQKVYIPVMNRFGFKILNINFTEFNPKIPFKDIISSINKETEHFSDNLFLRVGEPEKEFSFGIYKNFADFLDQSENQTEIMGKFELASKKAPDNIQFSFKVSKFRHFFDFTRLLKRDFTIETQKIVKNIKNSKNTSNDEFTDQKWFTSNNKKKCLSKKEKKVFIALIEKPDTTIKDISEDKSISLNRHTVSRMRKKFLDNGLMRKIIVPNIKKLDYNLFVFYHFKFLSNKPVSQKLLSFLDKDSTILFLYNKFEVVLLSAFKKYSDYKEDKIKKYSYLNSKELLDKKSPNPRKFVIPHLKYMNKFDFGSLSKKI